MGTPAERHASNWMEVGDRRGQRPYFSSRNVPKSVPRPIVSPDSGASMLSWNTGLASRQREKQPLVPRPSRKKCRRRHTAAIGNVNLAAGPLDKSKASECNFRSVATEDRLGSLKRKMQRRFDLDGIRRTAMTTLVQWCRNLVQCGGEHLHFVNSFLAGF